MKSVSKVQRFRYVVLFFFLFVVTVITVLHQRIPGMPAVDAICPFGGLEGLYKLVASGSLVRRLQPLSFILLLATVLLALVVGRFFCGWICALGALQGFFGFIGRKLWKKRPVIPARVDRYLRWTKYVILVVVLYLTWRAGSLIIRPYDPFAAYAHLSAGWSELWGEFAVGFVILVVSLLLSVVYDRFFCKYLCPLGAFLALVSRISPFRIRRDEKSCIHCAACDRKCPMNIDVSHPDAVRSPECINCQECVTVCPTGKSTLVNTFFGKKVSVWVVVGLGLGIYAATLGVAFFTGNASYAEPSLSQEAQKGVLTPEAIKGSHTIQDVISAFGLDKALLYKHLGLDEKRVPVSTRLKDIASLIGRDFETETVRETLKDLIGGTSYSSEAQTGDLLEKKEQTPSSHLVVPEGFVLEGTMTINEVAEKLHTTPLEVIHKLGLSENIPVDKPLRDLKEEYDFTIPDLRKRLQ